MNGTNYQTVTKKLDQFKLVVVSGTRLSRKNWSRTIRHLLQCPLSNKNLIPEKDDSFVKFGNFSDVKKIIQSRVFYPTFITGLSGNGKTFSVEQACATLGRELIRVNITIETDEDDLIGGFRLVDGETVWHNGPSH